MPLKIFFTLFLLAPCTVFIVLISVTTGSDIHPDELEKPPASTGSAATRCPAEQNSLFKAKSGLYQPQSEAFASVRPVSRSLLSSPFVLKIEKIFRDQGSIVKKGEAVAVISSPALSKMIRQWKQAASQVKLAKDALELASLKKKSALATKTDVITAELSLSAEKEALDTVQAGLREALLRLGQILPPGDIDLKSLKASHALNSFKEDCFMVSAPMNGVIEKRFVSEGETVSTDTILFSIQDVSRLILDVKVPCRRVGLWLSGKVFVGKDRKSPLSLLSSKAVSDAETGLCRLSYLEENPQGDLLPGVITTVRLLGTPVPCVYVPVRAVVSRKGKDYCMVKRPSGLKAVAVKTGRASGEMIAISEGLLPGDLVVTENAYELLYRDINRLMKFEEQ